MAKENVNTKHKKRDIATYRFYFELVLMGVAAVWMIRFSNSLSSLTGILAFPEYVTSAFWCVCGFLLAAAAYKTVFAITKRQFEVLPADFVLYWAAAYFAAIGLLFVETKLPQFMFYSQTVLVYTVVLIVVAVLEIINFLADGQLYKKVFAVKENGKK